MKNYILLILLCLAIDSSAQTAKTTAVKLNDKSIVRDLEGNIYNYTIWSKLMETGLYTVKPIEGGEFALHRLTPEQAERNRELKNKAIEGMSKPRTSEVFVEGEKFKADRFTSLNKLKFDLKKEPNKVYVLNFWFINCPPCKREIPELNAIVQKYKENKDVVFLGIALDGASDLIPFLKTMPFNYEIIPDGRYYTEKYGVKSYPTHVIVGKDGLIKFSTLGLAPNTIHWVDKTIKEQLVL